MDGWKRRVEKLSENALYSQPSIHGQSENGWNGRVEKLSEEYNVPPTIHGQSEHDWKAWKAIREYPSYPWTVRAWLKKLEGKGGKVIREYNVPPAIHGQSKHAWKRVEKLLKNTMYTQPSMDGSLRMAGRGGWKSYPRIQWAPGQFEAGWKGRVKKLTENTMYPEPSIDSPRREDHRRKVIWGSKDIKLLGWGKSVRTWVHVLPLSM